MATSTTTNVQGLAELDRLLKTLPANIEFNILRGALRAGQKPVVERAKERAPQRKGELRRSIRVRADARAKKRGFARVDVVAGNKTAWYARLLHTGTGSYFKGQGGRSQRGPYVIRAKDNKGQRVGSAERRVLSRNVDEAKALAFAGKYRALVVHPGIRPVPYMTEAAELLDGEALNAFVAYVRRRLPREIRKQQKAAS